MLCFYLNDTATTEIYTLSLHDALPISTGRPAASRTSTRTVVSPPGSSAGSRGAAVTVSLRESGGTGRFRVPEANAGRRGAPARSEEHTSELQSRQYLVCRLLLEKKKKY